MAKRAELTIGCTVMKVGARRDCYTPAEGVFGTVRDVDGPTASVRWEDGTVSAGNYAWWCTTSQLKVVPDRMPIADVRWEEES